MKDTTSTESSETVLKKKYPKLLDKFFAGMTDDFAIYEGVDKEDHHLVDDYLSKRTKGQQIRNPNTKSTSTQKLDFKGMVD